MLAHTDFLTLEEAARFATKHAGKDITPGDFLRAAGRGQIRLGVVLHRSAKFQKCNAGKDGENIVRAGEIARLPETACKQLASLGRASWRTFDGFEHIKEGNVILGYTAAMLVPDEPDFETVPADCRVTGDAVHALADAFCDVPEPQPATESARDAPLPMTKAALIAAHKHEWQTIERDIADAKDNGLAAAAKAGARGWIESRAMDWARAKGKLKSTDKPADSLAQAMHNMGNLPGRRHTL